MYNTSQDTRTLQNPMHIASTRQAQALLDPQNWILPYRNSYNASGEGTIQTRSFLVPSTSPDPYHIYHSLHPQKVLHCLEQPSPRNPQINQSTTEC
mmetsp:Transcript_62964/g.112318  ORF Transcript_62964/g.112318 Transcript_62964/m.112318 type:complete len:96 (-) Transcript_62964:646-933(-)